jgi:hypothetical protein
MRRELNDIEYFNWCVAQPYNMVVSLRVRGELPPERLRAALAKAQARHPLLGVNTEPGPGGMPWFSSDGVGAIPVAVVDGAAPDDDRRLAERELGSTFDRDRAGEARLPLLRVTLLRPGDASQPAGLVFTAQHVVADGLSMAFLVRDLLRFLDDPDAPVTVLDAPASDAELLPARVRRRIPTSSLRFRLALALLRLYARLRFGGGSAAPPPRAVRYRSWALSPAETTALRARCRREGVSIQSAICAAFLPEFPAIHIPVNVRPFLARPVGESVGLFVGSADIRLKVRPGRAFWDEARRFQRRLRRALADPFRILRLFSKAVPAAAVKELGETLVRVVGAERAFAVTNLGVLDEGRLDLRSRTLRIESFSGAVTGIVDSSVLTVYTLEGRLRLELLASEPDPTATAVRDDGARAVRRLQDALEPNGR